MSISNIKSKLTQAISIKSDMLAAFSSRGLPVTSNTPFAQFPSLIMDIHDTVQAKEAFPRAEGVVVTPDAGYTALTQVTIPSEPNLAADNIVVGKSIYGVQGTAVAVDPIAELLENRIAELLDPDGLLPLFPWGMSNNTRLTKISLPAVSSIYSTNAFYGCSLLSQVYMPSLTSIPQNAFVSCTQLYSAVFGSITHVGPSAFRGCCQFIPGPEFDGAISVGQMAFYSTKMDRILPCHQSSIPNGCYQFTRVSEIPTSFYDTLSYIDTYGLANTRISSVSLKNCFVQQYAVSFCSDLTQITAQGCTFSNYAFYSCTNLVSVSISSAKSYIGTGCFAECTSLQSAYLHTSEANAYIGSNLFSRCTKLYALFVEGPWKFSGTYIVSNTVLRSLYLYHSSVMSLAGGSNVFAGCPIGYRYSYAKIFVPASLISAYQASTGWSYFSSLFTALEE